MLVIEADLTRSRSNSNKPLWTSKKSRKISKKPQKNGSQIKQCLKNSIVGLRQGKQVVGEDCLWPAMLEEEAHCWRMSHAPSCAGV